MRVLVFTNMWPSRGDAYGSFVATQVDDVRRAGVDTVVLPFDARRSRIRYGVAAVRLRAAVAAARPDVVHAHYGLTGLVGLSQRSVPQVTTFHGSDAYVGWQRRLSRIAAHRSTAICVSRVVAAQLRCRDATILPMGVDTDRFVPIDRADARAALGLDPAPRYLLFPAAPTNSVKRYALFAEVARRLDVAPLAYAGYSAAQAPLVLNAVDAVLMTSWHEGSPLTVREALACVTPVVSVPVGDVPDVLAGLPGCEVAAADPAALATAVHRALAAPRDDALRRRALETSRQEVARRLVELYRRVAASVG